LSWAVARSRSERQAKAAKGSRKFDYSGSQCLKALREEGISTVLVNPNIATIQTSERFSERIRFLPVTAPSVARIIEEDRPDAIMLGFGGQTALNCGIQLSEEGVLEKYGVKVLGTPVLGIRETEDRDLFKEAMTDAGVPVPKSFAAYSAAEARAAADGLGYPVMVRVAFTLGGKGGGVARSRAELEEIVEKGLNSSLTHQVLVEEYLGEWKQIEYEIMRDSYDNSVTICNMENVLSMRVHTGDNVVVAPSQTITNSEYHGLRSAAIRAAKRVGIVGECNIQFALQTSSEKYAAIEINARMSRSSALASKATGYPLAYVATKLALGYSLTELKNKVSGVTSALFEPSLDYLVVKMPRWDTDKFDGASRNIGTAMKSIGEVMAIGRSFEEAVQKASRMLGTRREGVVSGEPAEKAALLERLRMPTDTIIFDAADALLAGASEEEVSAASVIDPWFVSKLSRIASTYARLRAAKKAATPQPDLLRLAKSQGFSDAQIGDLVDLDEDKIRDARSRLGIEPATKVIDTLAAEWPAKTNYLYQTFNGNEDEAQPTGKRKVMVLGAGPYRIGSSVEFDWGTMNMAWALKAQGIEEVIVVNCNPETVSTDFDMSDRLYFEELSVERLLSIYNRERPEGMVFCVGGQTPNDLCLKLHNKGVRVLGTAAESIETAEDRSKFSALLDRLGIPQPRWGSFRSPAEALDFCEGVGYPVIVRPSHVLSGSAMRVIWESGELEGYMERALRANPDYPVTVSEFLTDAREVEVDAVSDGNQTVIGAIIEHVQNAGVHSGDAVMSIPTLSVDAAAKGKIRTYTRSIARELKAKGPLNIQYLVKGKSVFVIECNLRASRSLPYVSKATGADLVSLAASVILGGDLAGRGDVPDPRRYAVKVPQFSFLQMEGSDPKVGVEMRSTGEVACFGDTFEEALADALVASGHRLLRAGDSGVLLVGERQDEDEARQVVDAFTRRGLKLEVVGGRSPTTDAAGAISAISAGRLAFLLSFNANANTTDPEMHRIRRKAVDMQVQVFNTREEAEAILKCVAAAGGGG
jgi:carbamoyl-phosphate synthase large subunit